MSTERQGPPTLVQDLREAAAQAYRPHAPGQPGRWVVSFPKSGVTWLKYLVVEVARSLQPAGAPTPEPPTSTIEVGPVLSDLGLPPVGWTHDGGGIVLENGRRAGDRSLFFTPLRLGFVRQQVLLLLRDPRDVTVSHYYQATRRTATPIDIGSVDEFFVHPYYGLRRTLRFYRSWERSLRLTRDHHLLRYEDLVGSRPDLLADALTFLLGVEVPTHVARSVLDEASADRMRAKESAGLVSGMNRFGSSTDRMKVRRGVVGGHVDELSPASLEHGRRLLEATGFPFGYGTP